MIEMKLLDNAYSSLHEGLRCLQQAEKGEKDRYAFAILHISRYFELALKYTVYFMHPLLVFKKPYSKNLDDATTITPQEAFYIIKNSETDSLGEIEFTDKELKPFIRFKKIRNEIEHFVGDFSIEDVKEDIALFLETVESMVHDRADWYIPEHIDDDLLDLYLELIGEE